MIITVVKAKTNLHQVWQISDNFVNSNISKLVQNIFKTPKK